MERKVEENVCEGPHAELIGRLAASLMERTGENSFYEENMNKRRRP